MKSGIRLGTIFGIPLFVDLSWFLVAGLVSVTSEPLFRQFYPQLGLVLGFQFALLMFLSVLLHELGHSIEAKSQGIEVLSITMFLFGGMASIQREPSTPWHTFRMAIAGPLVSVSLALLTLLGSRELLGNALNSSLRDPAQLVEAIGPLRAAGGVMLLNLAQINLVLGLFNLLPGLPLDGGQVLKAALWKITGDRQKATRWSGYSGQALGLLMLVQGGILFFGGGGGSNGLWLALIGWFLYSNASRALQSGALQKVLLEEPAEQVMTRDFKLVEATMTLREFVDRYLLLQEAQHTVYVATADGRDRGLIQPEKVRHFDAVTWTQRTVIDLVTPLNQVDAIDQGTLLRDIILLLEERQVPFLVVLSAVGSVAGVIDRTDVVKILGKRLGFAVPEALLLQVKNEGRFPSQLGLVPLCQELARRSPSR
jgi:Zn-dependent protease